MLPIDLMGIFAYAEKDNRPPQKRGHRVMRSWFIDLATLSTIITNLGGLRTIKYTTYYPTRSGEPTVTICVAIGDELVSSESTTGRKILESIFGSSLDETITTLQNLSKRAYKLETAETVARELAPELYKNGVECFIPIIEKLCDHNPHLNDVIIDIIDGEDGSTSLDILDGNEETIFTISEIRNGSGGHIEVTGPFRTHKYEMPYDYGNTVEEVENMLNTAPEKVKKSDDDNQEEIEESTAYGDDINDGVQESSPRTRRTRRHPENEEPEKTRKNPNRLVPEPDARFYNIYIPSFPAYMSISKNILIDINTSLKK